jgi:hypothetical protein
LGTIGYGSGLAPFIGQVAALSPKLDRC